MVGLGEPYTLVHSVKVGLKCLCDIYLFVCVCSVSVLQSILSTEACKSGMPTVSQLIQTP